MSIQKNTEAFQVALSEVRNHCMCVRFDDIGGAFQVLYPEGFRLDGVRAVYEGIGKAVALRRMLAVMERHWKEG